MKKTLAASVALLLLVVAGARWAMLPEPLGAPDQPSSVRELSEGFAVGEPEEQGRVRDAERERVEVRTLPAPASAKPTTGSLIVKATYEVDGMPVPDLVIMAGLPGADHRVGRHRAATDGAGVVRFEDLPAGRIWVQNVRHDALLRAVIKACRPRRNDWTPEPLIQHR